MTLLVEGPQFGVLFVGLNHELFQTLSGFGEQCFLSDDLCEGAREFVNPWIG